ncbi:MAG: hypothetical protein U1F77_15190 [Kiritimatiellia bacterium]
MAHKMESMYEYDPERKQYRRRSGHAAGLTAPDAPAGKAKATGDIYDTRSGKKGGGAWGSRRSGSSSGPPTNLGKRIFWILFAVVAITWLTLTLILSRQHRIAGQPFSLRELLFSAPPPPMLDPAEP